MDNRLAGWQHDLEKGLRILRLAIDTHLITSHYLLPLLITKPGGLLVEVTDGTVDYNATNYRLSVFYDLAKVAVNRLAFSEGHELAPFGGTAVVITPGWLRSEMMLENFSSEANWRDALVTGRDGPTAPEGFAASESPRYVGRAIAHWLRIPIAAGGISSPSVPANSPANTNSPTWTAHGRTSGDTTKTLKRDRVSNPTTIDRPKATRRRCMLEVLDGPVPGSELG